MAGITHRGREVQFGGEKEYRLTSMEAGTKLAPTSPSNWEPKLLGELGAENFKDGVVKGLDQLSWADLNDKGKAKYALAYKAAHGDFPVIRVQPNPDYSKITWEKNGWIEVVSQPFDAAGLTHFLETYGWGHVHTSFMRGAPPPEQRQILFWVGMANLWSFLNSLEERGAKGNGEAAWRFDVKGLSLPTEEHLDRWGQVLGGKNKVATAFSKHCIINVRGNGKQYGHPDRIGMETRGGQTEEKRRMLDSLINGLQNGHWGAHPLERGASAFRLVRLGPDLKHDKKGSAIQPAELPSDFRELIKERLRDAPIDGMSAVDADRLFQFVKTAVLGKGKVEARVGAFDQRACVPLLNYEALPWLSAEAKAKVTEARKTFLKRLSELQTQGVVPADAGTRVAELIADWAKAAALADTIGGWLDGPNGRQRVIGVKEEAPIEPAVTEVEVKSPERAEVPPAPAVEPAVEPIVLQAPEPVAEEARVDQGLPGPPAAPLEVAAPPPVVPPEAPQVAISEVVAPVVEAPVQEARSNRTHTDDVAHWGHAPYADAPIDPQAFAPLPPAPRRTAAEWSAVLEATAQDPVAFAQTLRGLEQELAVDRDLAKALKNHDEALKGKLKALTSLRTSRLGRMLFGSKPERAMAEIGHKKLQVDTEQRHELLRDRASTLLKAQLPKALWGYLELDRDLAGPQSTPRLLRPVEQGLQFAGYEKYSSVQGSPERREIHTFFVRTARRDKERNPGPRWDLPGFHGSYSPKSGHFAIHQYQHLTLPRGSAGDVLADQLQMVIADGPLSRVAVTDIVNGATLDALTRFEPDGRRVLREGGTFAATPLHQTLTKALAVLGLKMGRIDLRLEETFLGQRLQLELEVLPKEAP